MPKSLLCLQSLAGKAIVYVVQTQIHVVSLSNVNKWRDSVRLFDALQLPPLGRIRVVAGEEGLARPVRWVHVVDIPDVRSWVGSGQLLLTTGYAWPRGDEEQRKLISDLHAHELAGVGMAVPQFFERFPQAAIDQAKELGFPLLEIPWEIPFVAITETISRAIMAEQSAILERSEEIHRSLTRAAVELDSLDDLISRISDTLGRPIVLFEPNGGLAASHYPVPEEVVDELHQLEPSELQASLPEAGSPVQIDRHGTPWLIGPVRLGQRLLGFIAVIDDGTSFSRLDFRAVEHAATIVALHFSYKQRLEIVQARLQYGLVDSLIEGRWEEIPEAVERARVIGFDPNATYQVCVLILHKESIPLDGEESFMRRESVAEKCRAFLRRAGAPALITVSLNRVIVLLPEDIDARELWELFDRETVGAGVSERVQGVEEIPDGFEQAVKALEWNDNVCFSLYADTLLPRVLEGDRTAFPIFVSRTLGSLLNGGRSDVLLSTLTALARNDFSHNLTAGELHIHPNTLRYRIRNIEKRLDGDLGDFDTRFRIRLAVEILDVRNKFPD